MPYNVTPSGAMGLFDLRLGAGVDAGEMEYWLSEGEKAIAAAAALRAHFEGTGRGHLITSNPGISAVYERIWSDVPGKPAAIVAKVLLDAKTTGRIERDQINLLRVNVAATGNAVVQVRDWQLAGGLRGMPQIVLGYKAPSMSSGPRTGIFGGPGFSAGPMVAALSLFWFMTKGMKGGAA